MNPTLELLLQRRSVRAYAPRPVTEHVRGLILQAAMRAPTAGNLMLYSVIDVRNQDAKDTLARTCDNQPFIAQAPLVLLFLADYQKWVDYFQACGVGELCRRQGAPLLWPQEADLLLACCDALIAAQTAVVAAESIGLGSCYVGDIMENYEVHRELFQLPQYAFPICLVCFGYPRGGEPRRPLTTRFSTEYVVFEDRYRALSESELRRMFDSEDAQASGQARAADEEGSPGARVYRRKFSAEFSREMRRSVRKMLERWMAPPGQVEPRE